LCRKPEIDSIPVPFSSSRITSIDTWLRSQSRNRLLALAAAAIVIIGYIDYATSAEITLSVFYTIPVLIFVWYGDRPTGIGLAVFATAVWWAANLGINPFHSNWGYALATLNRLAYYVFFAIGGAALRSRQDADRARIVAMERTRQLEKEIVQISEAEQQRIGQDLHDGLCQFLAAISCAAGSLADDLQEHSRPEAAEASELRKLLGQAVVEARSLARGIFPVQMDGAGLAAALQELAALTNRLMLTSVTFEELGEIRIAEPIVAMQLYRIAQEALSNALRHGQANKVLLRLRQEADQVELKVEDDGSGFNSESTPKHGMGLHTMRYRAQAINAVLQVGNNGSGGISVSCVGRFGAKPSTYTS
jgi:signal transduction histidine kinase